MDRVIIKGIEFYGFHGTFEEEKKLGGRYRVDVELLLSLRRPGKTDRLKDTVDYREVHRTVLDIGTNKRYHLLEALASRIADEIISKFNIFGVIVRIKKISPPLMGGVKYVGVEIRRYRGKEGHPNSLHG